MLPHLFAAVLTLYIVSTLFSSFFTPSHPPPLSLPDKKPKPALRITTNNTFNIAIISDLHYGEDESTFGPEQDRKSTLVIGKILDYEEPDFVVINGDLITGENTHKENSTKYVDQIVSPLVSKNYRWASTYGNHDTQYNLSREALFVEETKYSLSYTRHSPKGVGGVTNYWLPIYPPSSTENTEAGEEEGEKPALILYFFDSQGGEKYQVTRWIPFARWMPNWVETTAVSWFRSQRSVIEARWGVVPSLAFVHIPPTAFLTLQKARFPKKGGKDVHFPGLNDDVPVANQGEGRWGKKDARFMEALLETKGLHSVYSGHDHGNSWCGTWPRSEELGPKICFVKHTGYGGYGSWRRGSRVLGLKFDGNGEHGTRENGGMEVESWVRLEEGDVVQRVSLNETYGLDVYPTDDGEKR